MSCDMFMVFDVLHTDWALGVVSEPLVHTGAMEGVEARQCAEFLARDVLSLAH